MRPNFFTMMNNGINEHLDIILGKCLDSGIESVIEDEYSIYITFKNGNESEMWNANRYYAWLSSGKIGDFKWKDARPRKKTMRRLRKLLKQYYINKYTL